MAAEDLEHGAPDMGFGCREEGLEGLVDEGYSFVSACYHYALFHAGEDAAQTQPAFHRLFIQRAEPLRNFPDVLCGELIGRSLCVERRKLEVSAG